MRAEPGLRAKHRPTSREGIMRRVIAIAFMVAALLAPTAANAGERLFDGALGAASGALVAGPAGFLAGGVIGYVAGPVSRAVWAFTDTIVTPITLATEGA